MSEQSSVRIYLDANALIQAVEGAGAVPDAIWRLLQSATDLATSELSLAEVLVAPLARRQPEIVRQYIEMAESRSGFAVVPVARSILIRAAHIRAEADSRRRSLKLPDAIHLATAEEVQCDIVLSDDQRLGPSPPMRRVPLVVREIDALMSPSDGPHA